MTKEEAFLILELLGNIDWKEPILLDSTHGKIALAQMKLVSAALETLERVYCE